MTTPRDHSPASGSQRSADRKEESEETAAARSGDFSRDPVLDPERVFSVISDEENAERVSAAMRTFVDRGDTATFAKAVAVFVRSANARGEPIERVLAILNELAEEREGAPYPHDWQPSELRRLVLRGVLLAYFGGDVVRTEARSQGLRRAAAERETDVGDAEQP